MWKSCILAGPGVIEITKETGLFNKLKSELSSKFSITCNTADTIEKEAVKVLIDRLLDANRLDTALVIDEIFAHNHRVRYI